MNATVSIIAYNRLDLTQKCLKSVLAAGGFAKLILTDNGSQEPVAAYFDSLAKNDDRIVVVKNTENLGFIAPNRTALEMTTTDTFLMLNNDTTVPRNFIASLMSPFKADKTCALSGPESGASRLRDDLTGFRGQPAEYIEGSCLMVRTDLAKKHGLFSKDLHFAYGEDADLALRMREKGFTLHTVAINVHHEGGATSSQIKGIVQIEQANHAVMRRRWSAYLSARTFNYTIIMRRQGALGDVLLTTPIIDAIAKRYPERRIIVETQAPDIFANDPRVMATRTPWTGDSKVLINLDMAYENMPHMHIVEAYRRVASDVLGDELDVEMVTRMGISDGWGPSKAGVKQSVAIHCEPTTWPGKNWPDSRWCELATWLRKEGWHVVLVGASKKSQVPCDDDYREMTSPMDLAAALGYCDLFIGHDSFPLHVAQSQGVPVIGLFGTTRSELILTKGSPALGINGTGPCAGDRHRHIGKTFVVCAGECMRSIPLERVQEAVIEMAGVLE